MKFSVKNVNHRSTINSLKSGHFEDLLMKKKSPSIVSKSRWVNVEKYHFLAALKIPNNHICIRSISLIFRGMKSKMSFYYIICSHTIYRFYVNKASNYSKIFNFNVVICVHIISVTFFNNTLENCSVHFVNEIYN